MGRTPCCDKSGLKKGPWTTEEDQKLVDFIQKHGHGNWRTLPKNAGLQRCGKSCRLRWTNYLRPDIKRGRFSFEEEETIIQLHSILGNKWSAIATRLPGRTDNEIKNYWNTHIRKRLLRMGIDPVTHSPRLDLLDLSSILRSTLYNSSQINLSRLLGVQPLVNPELLKLAASLMSSERKNQSLNSLQNSHENVQFSHTQQQQETPPQTYADKIETPLQEIVQYPHEEQHLINEWQNSSICASNLSQECYNFPSFDDHYQYGLELDQQVPPAADYSYETSTFSSHNSNQMNFGLTSVLSSPSSSPTQMNNSNSKSFNEDERESYCSDMLNFEIPDIFNERFM